MPDIRERVQEDQGLLKKIQNFVPGFRGYRRREDLRDADRLLRAQVAQKLGSLRRQVEDSRSLIVNLFNSKDPELIGGLINEFKRVEGQIAYAEMGYSGISPPIQVKEPELNRLYDYDASIIDALGSISQAIDQMRTSISSGDDQRSQKDILQVRSLVTDLSDKFGRRMRLVQGIEV